MSLQALGGKTVSSKPKHVIPVRPSQSQHIRYLCWNAGGLTSGTWEELLSQLSEPQLADVSVVILQETHWHGVSQFARDNWLIVSSGSSGEKGSGVAVMVKKTLPGLPKVTN